MNWPHLLELAKARPAVCELSWFQVNWPMHCLVRNHDTVYAQLYNFVQSNSSPDDHVQTDHTDIEAVQWTDQNSVVSTFSRRFAQPEIALG
jgi:hypothetical protein